MSDQNHSKPHHQNVWETDLRDPVDLEGDADDIEFWSPRKTSEKTSFHVGSLKRLEKRKKFPRRVVLSGNKTAWVASEVRAWMRDQLANRVATDGES